MRPQIHPERGKIAVGRRNRLRRRLFLSAQLALLAFITIFVFFNSSFFKLTGFVVSGNSLVSTSDITQATGFLPGENVWKLDLASGEAGVMAVPLILDAHIQRLWPNRVKVKVTERKALAQIPVGSSILTVDSRGRILAVGDNLTASSLPMVTGVPVEDSVRPGVTLNSDEMALAVAALQAIGPDWTAKVGEVHVDKSGLVLLYLKGGVPVYVGRPGPELTAKMGSLTAVLADLEKNHIVPEYIDLRYGDKPVVKPRGR